MKSPQSSQMDLGSPFALFSVCVLTICLLGTARCSNDKIHCPCLEVPKRNLTLLATDTCFQINQTFRYKCKGGTVRKVGTSGLIKCTQTDNGTAHWVPSNISLKCIPDPSRTTTQPPESTATKAHTDIPHVSTIATTVTGKEQDVRKTKATHRTTVTSTTAEPSNNGAHDAHVFPPAAHTVIGCASVVIVCALIGIGFYCYRRRSNSDEPPQMPEESIPMNPSEH
ncbi:interleukin-15 receptor subunit alpha isoform X7 [Anarrhichthys ocellatus]|uniref:interleukin-15 receptor subunit alpha isoform X7 n=1 Tax=Anarrhichthys ocellatus TaxID=433405 RepID=UPI0012EDEA29|nr:interleukin-15 receptor subunit alpha isoform X7 [Anarrhichthys ocellatus]